MKSLAFVLCLAACTIAHASSESWAKPYLTYNGDAVVEPIDDISTRLAVVAIRCNATHREVALAWTLVYRLAERRWERDHRVRTTAPRATPRWIAHLFYSVIDGAWYANGQNRLSKRQCVEAVESAVEDDQFPALMAQAAVDASFAAPVPTE